MMKLTDTGLPDKLASEILPLGTDSKTVNKLSEQMGWAWIKEEIPFTWKTQTKTAFRRRDHTYYDYSDRVRMMYLADAAIWARDNGYPVRDELLKRLPPNSTQSPPPGCGGKWPWGDHETELLRHLAAAVEKFWTYYDPEQPDTAPTNNQVADWLVSRKVQKYLADAMATLLRADNLPAGRRK